MKWKLILILAILLTISSIYTVQYIMTNVNYTFEIVDKENKTLYLRNDTGKYILNTTQGSSVVTTNYTINTNAYNTWTQKPNFASAFNIVDNCTARLYIEPISSDSNWPDVTVTMTYNDGTEFDNKTENDISSTGWHNFTLLLDKTAKIVHYDKNITLNVSVSSEGGTPSIKLFFDSLTRDSHLNLTTSTYVDISWIKTYDNTTKTEKTDFNTGEDVLIKANITDPIGSYDITEAKITIKKPDNTDIVTNVSMILEATDGSSPSLWKLYNYTLNGADTPTAGTYTIYVTGYESNDVNDVCKSTFSVS